MKKLLIIEDNLETQNLLRKVLSPLYELKMAPDLFNAYSLLEKERWDLILLDRSLPDGDGMDVCARLKKLSLDATVPVIMLTAHSELDEKIKGLSSGADDYVVKPFEPTELLARVEALLRRQELSSKVQPTVTFGNLVLNIESHAAFAKITEKEIKALDLTPIEFKILFTLVKNYGGEEVPRSSLVNIIWDKINLSARNIDTHICHLRKKIAPGNIHIKNKRNKGYYLKNMNMPKPVSSTILPQSLSV